MTSRCTPLGFLLLFLLSGACSKDKEAKPEKDKAAAAPDPDADLIDHTWAGKVHSSAGQMTFKRDGGALAAEMAYQLYGRVIISDKFTVTREADGTVKLVGSPENPLIGGGRFPLGELVGKLSADKSTIAGKHTLPEGEIEWSVTTTKKIGEIDPPLDVAAGEKSLLAGGWEGTIGDKPAKVTFASEGGKTTGVLTSGKDKVALDVKIEGDGKVTMVAVPTPTPRGLLAQTFVGYFGTAELLKISGTREETFTEGFVEQASSGPFSFERKAAGAAPAKKSSKTPAAKTKPKTK
jgi:hypothetical protein